MSQLPLVDRTKVRSFGDDVGKVAWVSDNDTLRS